MGELNSETKVTLEEFSLNMIAKMGAQGMSALVTLIDSTEGAIKNTKLKTTFDVTSTLSNLHTLGEGVVNLIEALQKYNAQEPGSEEAAYAAGRVTSVLFSIGSGATGFSVMTSYFSFVFDVGSQCLDTGLELVSQYKKRLQMYEELMNEGIKNNDYTEIQNQKDVLKQVEAASDLKDIATLLKELSDYCTLIGAVPQNGIPTNKINDAMEMYNSTIELQKRIVENIGKAVGENYFTISDVFGADLEQVNKDNTTAKKAVADPLILDLDGDGFNIEKKKAGAYFDLNCNGFAERINWTRSDAILTLDKNSNGKIDDGSEVFGDYHLLADGTRAKNGFEALAQYDTNKDGVIDAKDEVFNSLKLWMDADGDGVSAYGELKSLADMGIKAIHLNYENLNMATDTEALIGNVATFEYEDGTEANIGEMWVSSDLYDAIETVVVSVSETVNGLPDVRSFGTVNSLHTAMELDETGELLQMVTAFAQESNTATRITTVESILYRLCGTDSVAENSRGGEFDAKKLKVIESFMGEGFMGLNGANPNAAAAPILESVYNNIVEMYYFAMIGSSIKEHMDKLGTATDAKGNTVANVDPTVIGFKVSNLNLKCYEMS